MLLLDSFESGKFEKLPFQGLKFEQNQCLKSVKNVKLSFQLSNLVKKENLVSFEGVKWLKIKIPGREIWQKLNFRQFSRSKIHESYHFRKSYSVKIKIWTVLKC